MDEQYRHRYDGLSALAVHSGKRGAQTMIQRLVLILVLALQPIVALAQSGPQLDVVLPDDEEHIVGQPIVLRLKLLVPTWMLKPPRWPELEVPSLLVRLPERASTPVTETINGETWSGISRAYRLYPLTTGTFEIPAQTMQFTYAEPGTTKPIDDDVDIAAIRFSVVLPKGAEGLNPPIVANGLTLTQKLGDNTQLQVGDAVTRTVTAEIQGTTPILIPALIPPLETVETDIAPLRSYPSEPVVHDSENRGVLSGTRTDSVSYVAQAGGTAVLPQISVQWFNVESDKVETATLDGMTLSIAEPPPPPPGPTDYARWVAITAGAVALVWLFARFIWPHLRQAALWGRACWLASERYANRRVLQALQARDLAATMTALESWVCFYPLTMVTERAQMTAALTQIGAARYGTVTDTASAQAWQNARRVYRYLRHQLRQQQKHSETLKGLPDLNPN
jgi:hypothetical protein